jgi:hypothetical protein
VQKKNLFDLLQRSQLEDTIALLPKNQVGEIPCEKC